MIKKIIHERGTQQSRFETITANKEGGVLFAEITAPPMNLMEPELVRDLVCLGSFWATEAALSLAVLTYNLTVLFQRHLGWQTKVTIHSLRFWLFVTAGVISHPQGKTTIKLAVPPRERDWWNSLWEKILSPFPNCNAVQNRPAFSG
jgi:hypothetical protein